MFTSDRNYFSRFWARTYKVWCYNKLYPDNEMYSMKFEKKVRERHEKLSLQDDVELIVPRSSGDLGPCVAAVFLHSIWQPLMHSGGTEV